MTSRIEARRSLKRLRRRPVKLVLPGYGMALRRGQRAIRDTLLHYDVRLQRIDRGPVSYTHLTLPTNVAV